MFILIVSVNKAKFVINKEQHVFSYNLGLIALVNVYMYKKNMLQHYLAFVAQLLMADCDMVIPI